MEQKLKNYCFTQDWNSTLISYLKVCLLTCTKTLFLSVKLWYEKLETILSLHYQGRIILLNTEFQLSIIYEDVFMKRHGN